VSASAMNEVLIKRERLSSRRLACSLLPIQAPRGGPRSRPSRRPTLVCRCYSRPLFHVTISMSGRQSIYPSAGTAVSASSNHVLNYLSSCISSVDLTCRTVSSSHCAGKYAELTTYCPSLQLESINNHLQEQTIDFKRFSNVLASKKHFDLVSEKEIKEAKAHLSAEITPQLEQLLSKAKEALEREEGKAKALKTTVGLLFKTMFCLSG
jgi:hypothetical protein